MRIASLGGGPAGLYFSILMKKAFPDVEITVYERNRADDTFGWGVVFSDETLSNFEEADQETYAAIRTGDFWIGVANVMASVGFGYAAVWLGAMLARR